MAACTTPTPSLKDLPKVPETLKTQLEGFKPEHMKHASTEEKNVLPSAEDVKQEKQHNDLIHGVENFSTQKLKHTDTLEKVILPNAEDVKAEKSQKALLEGVESFDQNKLKHTTTEEKNPLPDKSVIEAEKGQQQFIAGIENFDPKKIEAYRAGREKYVANERHHRSRENHSLIPEDLSHFDLANSRKK